MYAPINNSLSKALLRTLPPILTGLATLFKQRTLHHSRLALKMLPSWIIKHLQEGFYKIMFPQKPLHRSLFMCTTSITKPLNSYIIENISKFSSSTYLKDSMYQEKHVFLYKQATGMLIILALFFWEKKLLQFLAQSSHLGCCITTTKFYVQNNSVEVSTILFCDNAAF